MSKSTKNTQQKAPLQPEQEQLSAATTTRGEGSGPSASGEGETETEVADVIQSGEVSQEEIPSETEQGADSEDAASHIEQTPDEPEAEKQPEQEQALESETASEGSHDTTASLSVAPAAFAVGATSEVLSTATPPADLHPGLTRVLIGYPDDFTGARHFRDGDVRPVSSEVAAQLVKAGIATIVKEK